jgi:hypothetical protein
MGVMNDRPFFPVSVHSGLELSTVVQGGGEIKEEDVQHLPKYVKLLTSQVFMKRPSPSGVPSAIQKVSVAKITKLSLLASVTKTEKTMIALWLNIQQTGALRPDWPDYYVPTTRSYNTIIHADLAAQEQ